MRAAGLSGGSLAWQPAGLDRPAFPEENTVSTVATLPLADSADCVQSSMVNTLMGACGLQAVPDGDDTDAAGKAVMAVISLVGDVEWTVFMNFCPETASALASRFAGFTIPADSGDLVDAIGELANLLGGEVKTQLDQRGLKADISLPSVLKGDNVAVLIPRDAPVARRRFQTDLGTMSAGVVVGHKLVPAA